MLTAIGASWVSIQERPAAYYAFLLALQTGLLGLFASLDVVLFYIFFEFTLIPLFFLIGLWGGPQRRRAAVTFFLYTLAGSLLTLLGVISLVAVHYQHIAGKHPHFSIPELTRGLSTLNWSEWKTADSLDEPAGLDLLAASGWFCDQGAAFSVSYLAAAGTRRSADGRVDFAGRRALEGGELWSPAVQYRHDSPGVGRDVSAPGHPVGYRHHLRGTGGAGERRT